MPRKNAVLTLRALALACALLPWGATALAVPSLNPTGNLPIVVLDDGTLWRFWTGELERIGDDADWLSAQAMPVLGFQMLALKRDGSLWAMEDSLSGVALCDPAEVQRARTEPVRVGSDSDWSAAVHGPFFAAAIKKDGTLWMARGPIHRGYCGFRRYGTESDWAAVTIGERSVLALKTDGSLWAWGTNTKGALGVGDTKERQEPTRVGTDSDWVSVATTGEFTVALKRDGSLWGWGWNWAGPLGLPADGPFRTVPVRLDAANDWAAVAPGRAHVVGLRTDGSLWVWGSNWANGLGLGYDRLWEGPVGFTRLGSDSDWVRVSGSGAVKSSGEVYGWGSAWSSANKVRLVPVPVADPWRWKSIATMQESSFAVRDDGSLWAWGANVIGGGWSDKGVLGLGSGDIADRTVPTRIGERSDWVEVDAQGKNAVARRADGSLWYWGWSWNYDPERSLWNTVVVEPTAVEAAGPWAVVSHGDGYVLALKEDGTLWAWGNNRSGRLGIGNGVERANLPVQVGGSDRWRQISAGNYNSIGVKGNGTLWAWGYAISDVPLRISEDTDWVTSSAGNGALYAVKADGSLWAWLPGEWSGWLPFENFLRLLPPAGREGVACVSPSWAGDKFLHCVLADGSLWRWWWPRWEGGVIRHYPPIRVGDDDDWERVVMSEYPLDQRGLVLKRDGRLFAMGHGLRGQLGIGEYGSQLVPRVFFGPTDTVAPAGSLGVDTAAGGGGQVVLRPEASDAGGSGLESMRFSFGDGAWNSWEFYRTSRVWNPSGLPGTRRVCVQYRDGAGNVSAVDPTAGGEQGACVEVEVFPLPGEVGLIGPSGLSAASRPVLRWRALPGADSYELRLRGRALKAVRLAFTASAAGCGAGEERCAARPDTRLPRGPWLLSVRARNAAGAGPWSAPTEFRTP